MPCCWDCSGSSPSTSTCEHELRATEEQLSQALFGARPAAEALIAETRRRGARLRPVLPDVLELPREHGGVARGSVRAPGAPRRGRGQSAARGGRRAVRERGGERLEWAALDWNELALGFYRGLGAHDDERVDHPPPGSARRSSALAAEGAAAARPGAPAPVAFPASSAVPRGRALVVQWIRRPPPKR